MNCSGFWAFVRSSPPVVLDRQKIGRGRLRGEPPISRSRLSRLRDHGHRCQPPHSPRHLRRRGSACLAAVIAAACSRRRWSHFLCRVAHSDTGLFITQTGGHDRGGLDAARSLAGGALSARFQVRHARRVVSSMCRSAARAPQSRRAAGPHGGGDPWDTYGLRSDLRLEYGVMVMVIARWRACFSSGKELLTLPMPERARAMGVRGRHWWSASFVGTVFCPPSGCFQRPVPTFSRAGAEVYERYQRTG